MAEKQLGVRLSAVGGDKLRAEFVGLGRDGKTAFDAIGRGAANASVPVQEFERRSTQAGGGASRMGSQFQNAGYQVQDFAVQVASGTSATRALGQQLPQLLSGFGLWGVAAGTAVAVGLPLVQMLFDTGEASKTVKEHIEDLERSTSAMTRAAAAAATPIAGLTAVYRELADEVQRAGQASLFFTRFQAERDLFGAARSVGTKFGSFAPPQFPARPPAPSDPSLPAWANPLDPTYLRELDAANEAVRRQEEALREMQDELGATEQQTEALRQAFLRLESANSVAAVARDAENLLTLLTEVAANAGADQEALAALAAPVKAVFDQATAQIKAAQMEAQRLREAYDGTATALAQLTADQATAERMLAEVTDQATGQIIGGKEDVAEQIRRIIREIERQIAKTKELAGETDTASKRMIRAYQEYGASRREGEAWAVSPAGYEAQYIAARASGAGSRNEEIVKATVAAAEQLGVAAKDLLAVMSFESGIDPSRWGGKDGKYLGLIQFSPENQRHYGVNQGQSVTEQMAAVVRYLKDTGVGPGSSLANIYAAILAGDARKVHASDLAAGGVVGDVTKATGGSQFAPHLARAQGLLAAYPDTAQAAAAAIAELTRAEEEGVKARRDMLTTMEERVQMAALEAAAVGKSAYEAARERAVLELTNDAKARGIDLTEKVAGTEKTWAQTIQETAHALAQSAQQQAVMQDRQRETAEFLREQAAEMARQREDFAGSFASAFAGVIDGTRKVGDAFAEMFKRIAAERAQIGLEKLGGWLFDAVFGGLGGGGGDVLAGALAGAGVPGVVSVMHSGGIAGYGGSSRLVHPLAMLGAERFHAGGWPGLRPGEVPAILERGERVVSRADARLAEGKPTVIQLKLDPSLRASILEEAYGQSVQVATQQAASGEMMLPDRMANYRRDSRKRVRY